METAMFKKRPPYRFLACLVLFALVGCASGLPSESISDLNDANIARDKARVMDGPDGGDASNNREESTPLFGAAGSYMGNATSAQLLTKTSREAQASNGGHAQMAFQVQGGDSSTMLALSKHVAEDPALALLKGQIEVVFSAFKEAKPESRAALTAELDRLRLLVIERVDAVTKAWREAQASAATAGKVDLSTLATIIVWNWVQGNASGMAHVGLTDAEATALAAAAASNERIAKSIAGKPEAIRAENQKPDAE